MIVVQLLSVIESQAEMKKTFADGGAVFSFAWDAWSCEKDLARQYLACYGHALTEDFRMLRACLFIKKIAGHYIFILLHHIDRLIRTSNYQRFGRTPHTAIC